MMDMRDTTELEADDIDLTADNRYISDTIAVILIPEKKGTFLKHTEYEITSEKYKSRVERRYNDFVHLHSHLMAKYSNRMIPRLPPKHLLLDSLLEERRCGLQRWLRMLSHHNSVADDRIFNCFLTDTSNDRQALLQEEFSKDPDEFHHLSSGVKLPDIDKNQLANQNDKIRVMLNYTIKLKRLIEQQAKRELNQSKDFSEIAHVLSSMGRDENDHNLNDFSNNFIEVSKESEKVSKNQQQAVMERLEMIIDALTAHSDLCERIDKRINSEPQTNLIRSKIQHAVRSPEAKERQRSELEATERQNCFAMLCLNQETKFAERYLKLVPSILLQFSHEEFKGFTSIAEVFKRIVQVESDKMN